MEVKPSVDCMGGVYVAGANVGENNTVGDPVNAITGGVSADQVADLELFLDHVGLSDVVRLTKITCLS